MKETQAAITLGETAGSTANTFHHCLQPTSQTRHEETREFQVLTYPKFLQKFEKKGLWCGKKGRKTERERERKKQRS
jgi:hypothetical protein